MNSRTLKILVIVLVSVLCAGLFIVGILWLLNQYDVINVQSFLDYLYAQMFALIAIVSGLGIAGVVSLVSGLLYNSYRVEQRHQAIDAQTTQLHIIDRLDIVQAKQDVIDAKLDALLRYETIMANKSLSNSIVPSKEDKSKLSLWLASTTQKATDVSNTVKAIANIKPIVDEAKATIKEVVEQVDKDAHYKNLVKATM